MTQQSRLQQMEYIRRQEQQINDLLDELDELRSSISHLPKFKDGPYIVHEGPAYTPDGRCGYIEPFSSTPILTIKHTHDPDEDEHWEAEECYYNNPKL